MSSRHGVEYLISYGFEHVAGELGCHVAVGILHFEKRKKTFYVAKIRVVFERLFWVLQC
jgi:hypothetical protein